LLLPSSDVFVTIALAGLAVGAWLTLGVFTRRQSTLMKTLLATQAELASSERELAAARRQAAQSDGDRHFLARVVRETPHIAQQLHAGKAGGREIPGLLLAAVVRLVEPTRAMVAIRRRPAASDPERHLRLTVAATFPPGYLAVGSEIPIGRGEIGFAAEAQRVMDRRDFESLPAPTRSRLREETEAGCVPDVVAPMVFGEEVVGAIVLEGGRRSLDVTNAIRLLAQLGAGSVHTQAKYTEMKATASVDGLTGIFNKRYLTQRLADELRRAQDEIGSVAVFIFDLDNFKHYNDHNGHVAGDRLLQLLSKLVLDNIRRDAVFGRYGGEEFLVIFPGARRDRALAAAENVRKAVAAHDFPFRRGQPLGVVSISGGVAECPVDGADAASLVRAADEALYQAKRSGRNRVVAYEPTWVGGEEALVPIEEADEARARAGRQLPATVGQAGKPVTLDSGAGRSDDGTDAS
jgi:diguanylate cyclase (GGDEF)-like protein